jgi:hypothetical protein
MPTWELMPARPAAAVFAPPQSSPVIVVASAPARRLHEGRWFTNSFAATCGVLVALFLACAGLALFGNLSDSGAGEELAAAAKRQALADLKEFGIKSLSQETKAYEYAGRWIVDGPAITVENQIAVIRAEYVVATAGGVRRWGCVGLEMDGEDLR